MSAAIEQSTQPVPRFVRKYSRLERTNALALYDQVGSLEKAAETLGIPVSTLHGWVQSGDYDSELRTQKSKDLAEKFEDAANRYLDLASKKSKKAPFNHLLTAAGIAVDKMQLLRGEATSISVNVERQELTVTLKATLDELAQEAIDITPE